MFLKLMTAGDSRPDRHPSRTFRLIEVASVTFGHDEDAELRPFSYADVTSAAGHTERLVVVGKAYVLNDQGNTIDTFSDLAAGRAPGRNGREAANAAGG
jgi:hypothetical protein